MTALSIRPPDPHLQRSPGSVPGGVPPPVPPRSADPVGIGGQSGTPVRHLERPPNARACAQCRQSVQAYRCTVF